jgi:uncharacterized protein (DUF1778 family)
MSLKNAQITVRLDPAIKELLDTAAQKERRTLSGMVEVMILEYASHMDTSGRTIAVPPSISGKKKQ